MSDADERREKKRGVVMSLFCLMSGATQTHRYALFVLGTERDAPKCSLCARLGGQHTRAHTCRGLGPERDAAHPPKSPYHVGRYLREQGRHTHNTKPAAANELLLYTLMKYNCITVGK